MENFMSVKNAENNGETESLADSKTFVAKYEEWEFEATGKFLLNLNKRKIVTRNGNWFVSKGLVWKEFEMFLASQENKGLRERLNQKFGSFKVGTLLDRSKFLINTKRGSGIYRINYENLFGMKMLDLLDEKHLFHSQLDVDSKLETVGDWLPLEYIGTEIKPDEKQKDSANKFQCTICQKCFDRSLTYRYHIQEHDVDMKCDWSKKLCKFSDPIVKVNAAIAKSKVCFKYSCNKPNLIVEHVLLVKAFTLYAVPVAMGNDYFSLDLRILNDSDKHTFVFIIRDQSRQNLRIAEKHNYEHHKVNGINTSLIKDPVLNNKRNFVKKQQLFPHVPNEPYRNSASIDDLKKLSPEFADYMNNNKRLTVQCMQGTLKFLLEMEDLHRCFMGSIIQKQVKLEKNALGYTFKISSTQKKGAFVENLLNYRDQVYIRFVNGKPSVKDEDFSLSDLIKTDEEFLRNFKIPNSKVYLGDIIEVNNGSIVFFSVQDIPLTQEYLIVIRPSRFQLNLQYRALQELNKFSALEMSRFFFPQFARTGYKDMPRTCLLLHNTNIYKDPEQLQAVQNICEETPCRDETYILEGPAGSGKTCVLIESIIQLYEKAEKNKILVLAPTESACDVLAEPLSKFLKDKNKLSDMARVYTHLYKREVDSELPEEQLTLLKVSNVYGKHFYPAVDDLHNKRIVVMTICLAGSMSLGRFGRDCNSRPVFNYIFVDNATMVTEPELLVALVNTLSPTASLILAGDRHQMGPSVYCRRANDFGLGISLMERILQYDCYQLDIKAVQSTNVYTRLCNNYRSHPEIVDICNQIFHDKVKPMGNLAELSTFSNWCRLVNPFSPCVVHHVPTDNMQILIDSNLAALDLILKYIKELMYFGIDDKKVIDKHIGIITNYNWESKFLRNEMNMRGWNGIEIGTLENFCGQEKEIIFCLTTINQKYFETKYNAKNINSIILRAKSLLMFVGDVHAMQNNEYLLCIITTCKKRKMLIMDDDVVDMNLSFDNLMLNEHAKGTNGPAIQLPSKGATPKYNAAQNKQNQQNRTSITNGNGNLSRRMKKGNNAHNPQMQQKNAEKFKDLMQPAFKHQQNNPIENLFENSNKAHFSAKNSNDFKAGNKPQTASAAKNAGDANKNNNLRNQQPMQKNTNLRSEPPTPPSYVELQNDAFLQQQRQELQQHQTMNNANVSSLPIQLTFHFPNAANMPTAPMLQQVYPVPTPACRELPPQYQPPPYEFTEYRQPKQQMEQKPTRTFAQQQSEPSAPPEESRRPFNKSRSQGKNKKLDSECIIV